MRLLKKSALQSASTLSPLDTEILKMVTASVAAIQFKPDGTILDANDNFLQAMGYARDEIIGQKHRIFTEEKYAESADYAEFWQRLRSGEVFNGQCPRLRKDGSKIWIQATYCPMKNDEGHVTHIIKLATDNSVRQATITQITHALEELEKGNLSYRLPKIDMPDLAALSFVYNRAMDKLSGLLSQIASVSGSVQSNGEDIQSSIDQLAGRTETQAATLEETAAAVEQLSTVAKDAAINAKEMDKNSAMTRDAAEESREIVGEVIAAMDRIQESSTKIAQIISVIDDISFQTNLLALNAGVEAARAGEAGRGFAVVASEVRNLAHRSSGSAKEIKDLIGQSTDHVDDGVKLVGRASTALDSIFQQVGDITSSVRDISDGLNEQASTLTEINSAISQIDQVTQENAAMVNETSDRSSALMQQAQRMTQEVSTFRHGHAPRLVEDDPSEAAADDAFFRSNY